VTDGPIDSFVSDATCLRQEGFPMLRVFLATTNIFTSLVIGALAMGAVWYMAPETMQTLFQSASGLKAWLTNLGLEPKYNNFLYFLIEERQLVFMGFVIVTRMLLAILAAIFIAPFTEAI
jgi:hypothetical protein